MKIFSPESLSTTAGNFTVAVEIPEKLYPEANPDGTRPQVSVEVEAATQFVALKVLDYLNSEGLPSVVDAVMTKVVENTPEFQAGGVYDRVMDEDDSDADAAAELMENLMSEVHNPFINFPFAMNVTLNEEDVDQEYLVQVVINAPSGSIAVDGFINLTSSEMLKRLAISFMPEEDDDENDW